MNIKGLEKALDLSAISVGAQLKSYTRLVESDAAWRKLTEIPGKQIRRAAWKMSLLRLLKPGARRTETYVSDYYARWQKSNLLASNPATEPISTPVVWRGDRMQMSMWGWRYVYLWRLYRLIELVRPRRVIEIGCGNGFFPSILACRFPDVEFHGLELTKQGVQSAKDAQAHDHLPDPIVQFSPEPLLDTSGHKRVMFHQGSAREMPFDDGAFDLVFTVCSIEQMELIRRPALAEIARVTGKFLSNYEPFHDVNMNGLQRRYIKAMNFYEGSIAELKDFGLRPIFFDNDMPQKFYMNVGHVISEKVD